MQLTLILESSHQTSHLECIQPAVVRLQQYFPASHSNIHVTVYNHETILWVDLAQSLTQLQISQLAQSIANHCQTKVRVPMVFKSGFAAQMQYEFQMAA